MKEAPSKWKAFTEKLATEYRLSILQEETFEQLTNHKLPLWKMLAAVASAGILLIVLTAAAIVYTPLRGPVLNYVTKVETTDIVVLNQTIEQLENKIKAHEQYELSLRTILMGGVPDIDNSVNANSGNVSNITIPDAPSTQPVNTAPKTMRVAIRPTESQAINLTTPINGSISAQFMLDKGHYGVDVVAPKNTPVKAVMDGHVIVADWTIDTGNTIGIQHKNGYVSFYKHNSSLLKKAGSSVKAGEAIAIIGNTGRLTDGPHLHFELWHEGKALNPSDFINFE